jgi:hypothetical protein
MCRTNTAEVGLPRVEAHMPKAPLIECGNLSLTAMQAIPVITAIAHLIMTFVLIRMPGTPSLASLALYTQISLGFSATVFSFSLLNSLTQDENTRYLWIAVTVIAAVMTTLFALATAGVISAEIPCITMMILGLPFYIFLQWRGF